MNEFITVKLKDIGRIVTGKTPSSKEPESYGESYLFITPSDNFENKYIDKTIRSLSEYGKNVLNGKLLKENSVLVTCIGSAMGKVALNKFPAVTNQQINSIEVKEAFSSDYIYYCLKNNYTLFRNAASGSTALPILNKTDFEELPIKIHKNLKTQQSIAAVLSALDKKIALNNQINARLEKMAKTLYDYWFVQFDFPDANGKPYKSSGGEMVFDETLKREIPKGWEVKSLGEIADLYQPATLSEKELKKNGQFLVYGANGIIGKYNQFNHENPVVAVACRGNSCGAINITQPKSWITGNAMVVNPKNKNMCIDYIKNTLLVNNLDKVISGSAQPQITRTNFAPLKVILPSEALLKLYSDIVNSMFNKRINQIQQNAKLTQLRDFLLPMLMNGQVSATRENNDK